MPASITLTKLRGAVYERLSLDRRSPKSRVAVTVPTKFAGTVNFVVVSAELTIFDRSRRACRAFAYLAHALAHLKRSLRRFRCGSE